MNYVIYLNDFSISIAGPFRELCHLKRTSDSKHFRTHHWFAGKWMCFSVFRFVCSLSLIFRQLQCNFSLPKKVWDLLWKYAAVSTNSSFRLQHCTVVAIVLVVVVIAASAKRDFLTLQLGWPFLDEGDGYLSIMLHSKRGKNKRISLKGTVFELYS